MTINEKIILGAGCFWTVEAIFQGLEGVKNVIPGYYYLQSQSPKDKIETILLEYDSQKLPLQKILKIFSEIHNPTLIKWHDPNFPQLYRSLLTYKNQTDKEMIESFLLELQKEKNYQKPIATQIHLIDEWNFKVASNININYYKNHKNEGYCISVIEPKLQKIKKLGF